MRIGTALLWLAAALAAGDARAGGGDESRAPDPAAPGEPAAAAAEAAETFESLAQGAQPIGDVGALLGALVDRCPEENRALDRARCRATLAFLRQSLPERRFSVEVRDAAAISVSPYDEALKGYRIGLAACIACTSPIRAGRSTDPVFVTLKKPTEAKAGSDKPAGAASGAAGQALAAAVEITSLPLGFPSEAEARRWLGEVRPHLRAELIFDATASEWRFRSARGYALELVAGRIVDTCTGAVVLSSPPSTGVAERSAASSPAGDGCKARAAEAEAAAAGDDDEEAQLPSELSRTVIAEAMGRIRSQVFACFERFRVPGAAPLTFEVAGNGSVQSVRLGGALSGSPSGDCIVVAAHGAHFPRFDGPLQTFTYPFFLRR